MTDLQSGRQTHISDERLLDTTDRLCRILRSRRMWDTQYADDIFQEVYISLHKARERYDETKASWMHFAYIVAEGTVRDFFRSTQLVGKQWKGELFSTEPLDDKPVGVSHMGTPLSWELQTFPIREQKIIVMLLLGYSLREIANFLNISEHYIYQLIGNLRIMSSPSFSSQATDTQQERLAA